MYVGESHPMYQQHPGHYQPALYYQQTGYNFEYQPRSRPYQFFFDGLKCNCGTKSTPTTQTAAGSYQPQTTPMTTVGTNQSQTTTMIAAPSSPPATAMTAKTMNFFPRPHFTKKPNKIPSISRILRQKYWR